MARAVLIPAPLPVALLAMWTGFAGASNIAQARALGPAQAAAVVCSVEDGASRAADVQARVQQTQQTVEAGPFYQELLRRFTKAGSCRVKVDGTSVALTYMFPHEARLEAKVDSAIEYSEQRLTLQGMERDAALELLKKAAADSFGDAGCGLDWSKAPAREPNDDGTNLHSEVYEGTSCNCKARVTLRGKTVVGLMVSSSC